MIWSRLQHTISRPLTLSTLSTNSLRMPGKLSHADVREAIGLSPYEHGLSCSSRGHVRTVEIRQQAPAWIRPRDRVQGSEGSLYSRRLEIEWLKEGPEISGTWSCRMHLDCKHVAAVCLSHIGHPPAEGFYKEGGRAADGGFDAQDLQALFAPIGDE